MKLTHVKEQQAVAEWYKQEICRLLMWSEEEYTTFQHQQGLAYLHWYCNCLEDYRRALEGNKIFWSWWRNQWVGRERAYCDENVECLSITARRQLYECLNDGAYLIADIKPSVVVMQSINLKMLVYG